MGAFPPASESNNRGEASDNKGTVAEANANSVSPADANLADANAGCNNVCGRNIFTVALELKALTERLQAAFVNNAAAPEVDGIVRDAQAVGSVLQKTLTAPAQRLPIEASPVSPAPVGSVSTSSVTVPLVPSSDLNVPYNQRRDIDHSITMVEIMEATTDEERIRLISAASRHVVQSVLHKSVIDRDLQLMRQLCDHYNKACGPLTTASFLTRQMCKILLPHVECQADFILNQTPSVAIRLSEGFTFPKIGSVAAMISYLLHSCADGGDLGGFRYFYHLRINCGFTTCAVDYFTSVLKGRNRDMLLFLRDTAGFSVGDFRRGRGLDCDVQFLGSCIRTADQIKWLREDLLFSDRDLNDDFVAHVIYCGRSGVIMEAVKSGHISRHILGRALERKGVRDAFVGHL